MESKFADDAALYASSHDGLEEVASSFVCVARRCMGLDGKPDQILEYCNRN